MARLRPGRADPPDAARRPAARRGGRPSTRRATATALPRRADAALPAALAASSSPIPLSDVDETLDRLLRRRGARDRRRPARARRLRVVARRDRPAAARPDRGRPRARSPAATSRAASSPPTTAPRSAGSGLALNAMLDRLEEAFAQRQASEERLRRFLADASHELRTPLASIRGYAELFRMGASARPGGAATGDAADRGGGGADGRARRGPADAGAARRGARPGPRAGRPRRRSRATRSDDARATAPDRGDRRSTRQREAPTVLGDPTSCARCSPTCCATRSSTRPPATAIEVGVAPTRPATPSCGSATTGPGCRPGRTPPRCSSASGAPRAAASAGAAGAGLGLAIVAGIVDAHGGTVRAANAEGGGAEFIVELPMTSPFKNSRLGVDALSRAAMVPGSGEPG